MWPAESQCNAFYGNPRGRDGRASPTWEAANLVLVPVPWRAVASWDASIAIRKVRVHRKVADSLTRVLSAIWEASGRNQKAIEEWGCHKIGGAYNFRTQRGASKLSMHAYGCAIDLDPDRNAMGDQAPNFMHIPQVLNAFKAEGWRWGGMFGRPDAMHWQATQ